jgi:RimJ/RimL family protein N-acetyltransferase
MQMTLQTTRLILRRPAPGDWLPFRDFFRSDRAAHFGEMDEGRIWRQLAAELGHWEIFGCGMWAVTAHGDDTALGLVGPWCPPDWPETEIGWIMFDPATEGKGIATEAARSSLHHAFEVLGWATAVSYIAPGNDRSVRLAEKLGALRDRDAKGPTPETLVYRHPNPAEVAA